MSARTRSAFAGLRPVSFLLLLAFVLSPGVPALASPGAPAGADSGPVVALNSDVLTLDPGLILDNATWSVSSQLYDRLTALDPGDGHPVPSLAISWSVSADGLTWTFNLRPGVKFHDGTALDADAVLLNLTRWWDPASPYHTAEFPYFKRLFGYRGEAGAAITAITKVNASAVAITLAVRDTTLAAKLATPPFGIGSPAAIQAGTLATTGIGTGPYRLAAQVAGDHVTLEPNPAYWGAQAAALPLTFRVMTGDPGLQWSALQANTIQLMTPQAPFTSTQPLDLIRSDGRLRALWREDGNVGYLGINRGRAPFDNLLVRQAIAHAIDKTSLVAGHYGPRGYPASQIVPPTLWGADPAVVDYGYDPQLARDLLAQAGFPGGITTTLSLRTDVRNYLPDAAGTAETIHDDLEAAGIHAAVEILPSGEFLDRVMSGDLDLFLLGWIADGAHPALYLDPLLCGDFAALGPHDTALCDLLAEAGQITDFSAQLQAYRSASAGVHDSVPLVPLAHTRTLMAQNRSIVGFAPTTVYADPFASLRWVQSGIYLPLTIR